MATAITIQDFIDALKRIEADAGDVASQVTDALVFAEQILAAHGNIDLHTLPADILAQLGGLVAQLFPGTSPLAALAVGIVSSFTNIRTELTDGQAIVVGSAKSSDFKVGSLELLSFDDTIDFFAIRRTSTSDVAVALGIYSPPDAIGVPEPAAPEPVAVAAPDPVPVETPVEPEPPTSA